MNVLYFQGRVKSLIYFFFESKQISLLIYPQNSERCRPSTKSQARNGRIPKGNHSKYAAADKYLYIHEMNY